MVERRIPNPMVGGSNPSCPAKVEVLGMKTLISYIKMSKAELGKVIFPLKEQVRNAYITVFIVVSVITAFLALIDWIMGSGIAWIVR